MLSCSLERKCTRYAKKCTIEAKVEVRDSIITITEVRYKDTTLYVYLPQDTVLIEKILYVNKKGIVNLDTISETNGIIGVEAWVNKNLLGVNGYVADSTIYVTLENTIKEKNIWKFRFKEEFKKEKIVVKRNSSFAKFCIWFWWLFILITVLLIVRKIMQLKRGKF